jgi:hypothetical protein
MRAVNALMAPTTCNGRSAVTALRRSEPAELICAMLKSFSFDFSTRNYKAKARGHL